MRTILLAIAFTLSITSAAFATTWGGVTIGNDGWTKGYSNISDLDRLKALEASDCKSNSTLPDTCKLSWVHDNSWAAGVHCVNADGARLGVVDFGNSAKQAIEAVYKKALTNKSFVKSDCKLKNLVAGNGAQLKYKK